MPAAQLIVENAVIHTQDAAHPRATAMAVGADGKILSLRYDGDGGDDDGGFASLRGPNTTVLDLGGQTVLPGLLDAHCHHALTPSPAALNFSAEAAWADVCAAVRAFVAKFPEAEWIDGGAFGSHLLGELGVSTAPLAALDEVSGGKKVVLSDDSRHNRFANSAALAAGAITADSADPPDGRIGRTVGDAAGRLTGLLVEGAGLPVLKAMHAAADPDAAVRLALEGSRRGVAALHARGVTGFLDAAANFPLLKALGSLDAGHELRAWAVSAMLVNDRIFGNAVLGEDLFPIGKLTAGARHRPTFAKIFLDGVPPSGTGAFLHPYVGCCATAGRGEQTMGAAELSHWLSRCADLGLNVKVHCTGDASVRAVLDGVEELRAKGKGGDMLVHVAHSQFIAPEDVPRFKALGVVAEISPPLWFPGVIADAVAAVRPPEEARRMHPNRELVDAGALVAAGSDWPVSPDPDPWLGIAGLVTRKDPTGKHPGSLAPDQRLTRAEAVRAYTLDSARALGIDHLTGSLETGKSADFVVLDRDPFEVPEGEIAATTALQTWFAGEKVYEK